MPTMPDADQIKALLTRRDREWEEALKTGFPDYDPPLIPGMVEGWAKSIDEDFERTVADAFRYANEDTQ